MTRVLVDPPVTQRLDASLDALHRATRTPVTARRHWLEVWADCYPQYEPVAVVVDGREPGCLDGAALLALHRTPLLTGFVAMGHGPSDQARLPARGAQAAEALAEGVGDLLARLPTPWRVRFAQLPVDDPVAHAIARRHPATSIVPAPSSPTTRFREDREPRAYVSKNHHQQVRRMTNRLERDGLRLRLAGHRDPVEIARLMPDVERVCRARDHQLGRRSKLDDPNAGPFFRRIVAESARRGEVELVTLHVGDDLAAYVLSFLDDGAYRMWNCRFDPAWERYGVGRLANHHALARALADPTATEFDWMKGEEAYKASLATDVVPAVDLHVWSSPAVRDVLDAPRRAKVAAKPWVHRSERLTKAVATVRRG